MGLAERVGQLEKRFGAGTIEIDPDPVTFARESLNFQPAPWQEAVLQSASRRLLLNCSRQSGKSSTAAVLALYRALAVAHSLILMVSPSLRQSAELYRKVRDLAHGMPNPPAMNEDTKTSMTIGNGSRVISLPSSEATIRGYSAVDVVVFDEASRISDDLYFAVRPMVATSGGSIVAMSTPFGRRGWWWQAWEGGGDTWERTRITASDVPRIPRSFLDEELAEMGRWWYSQEYEGVFQEAEDSVFTFDDIAAVFDDRVRPLFPVSAAS